MTDIRQELLEKAISLTFPFFQRKLCGKNTDATSCTEAVKYR